MRQIKHIFSDMDGTLLDRDGNMSAVNQEAIEHSRLPFTLVSARAPMEMMAVIDALHLTAPQIAFNGGLIFRMQGHRLIPIEASSIPDLEAQQILHQVREQLPDVSVSCYGLNAWYAERIDAGIELERRITHQTPTLTSFDKLTKQTDLHLFKIMMITQDADELKGLQTYLRAMSLPNVAIQQSGRIFVEVTSKRAQKSTGIAFIQKMEHLREDELAAFGDGHNDLPMFASVGHAVVMGNALPEIKAAAELVTLTNNEDGVAYGLRKLLAENIG